MLTTESEASDLRTVFLCKLDNWVLILGLVYITINIELTFSPADRPPRKTGLSSVKFISRVE